MIIADDLIVLGAGYESLIGAYCSDFIAERSIILCRGGSVYFERDMKLRDAKTQKVIEGI